MGVVAVRDTFEAWTDGTGWMVRNSAGKSLRGCPGYGKVRTIGFLVEDMALTVADAFNAGDQEASILSDGTPLWDREECFAFFDQEGWFE
jgi:hypothetical protein